MPDISLLAYFFGTRPGAIAYNATHITLVPLALAALGFLLPSFDLIAIALVWAVHIGIDRALGLGLKYGAGFGFTHLGRIGGALAGVVTLMVRSRARARRLEPWPGTRRPSFETRPAGAPQDEGQEMRRSPAG